MTTPEDGTAPITLRLQVQGDYIGDLVVQPFDGQAFSPGQIEMMRELAESPGARAAQDPAARKTQPLHGRPGKRHCGTYA